MSLPSSQRPLVAGSPSAARSPTIRCVTTTDPTATRAKSQLAVVLADAALPAVDAALATLPRPQPGGRHAGIVVARGASDDLVAAAVDSLRVRNREDGEPRPTPVLRSPGRAGAVAAMARESWASVPLGAGADRFDRARLPSRLLRSSLAVVTLLPPLGSDIERPVALLARFADPRQIAAAQLHGPDAAAFAELAVPFQTRLFLLVGRVEPCFIGAATRDLLTAELAWEAFRELARDVAGPVAWQSPVVQHLVQLDHGPVRHPDEIDLTVRSLSRACAFVTGNIRSWLEAKLGIGDCRI